MIKRLLISLFMVNIIFLGACTLTQSGISKPSVENNTAPSVSKTATSSKPSSSPIISLVDSSFNQIVFSSESSGNDEVFVMNEDGSGQTRLTNNVARDTQPSWSPDGKK